MKAIKKAVKAVKLDWDVYAVIALGLTGIALILCKYL